MPKKKDTGGSSLAGWSEVIRKSGGESRAREAERRADAQAFITKLRETNNTLPELLRALLKAHDEDGVLRTNELLDELRYIGENT
jgi:transposase-like protein